MTDYTARELNKIEKRLAELSGSIKDKFIKQKASLLEKKIKLERDRNKRLNRLREELRALEKELLKPSYKIIETFEGPINIWEMKGEELVRTIDPESREG